MTVKKGNPFQSLQKHISGTCYEEFYAWTMIGFISIIIAGLLYLKFWKICRNIGKYIELSNKVLFEKKYLNYMLHSNHLNLCCNNIID